METPRRAFALSRAALAAASLFASAAAPAAELTWDADGAASAALGGTGTWNLLGSTWDNAGTAQAWTSADSAIFGTTAGTVTLGTDITAQGLTFSVDGYTLTGSTLTLGGGITANGSATISSGITLGAASSWSVANTKTLTVSGTIGGGFALTKSGEGTLALNAANTFSGGLTLSSGSITLGDNAGLGSGTLTFAGGTLQTNGSNRVVANNLAFRASTSSGLVGSPAGDILYTGAASGSGTAVLNSNVSRSVWLQGDWSGFTGTLSLTQYTDGTNYRLGGAPGLTTSNDLTNASNLSQAKVVMAGTPTNRALSWNGVAGATVRIGELSGTGGRIDASGRAANWEVGALGTSTTFAGVIAGTGTSLTKVGVGTLTLTGANTYTGGTSVKGGELVISAESGLGAAPGSYVANHLTLDNGALVVTAGMTLGVNRGITLGSGGAWLRSTALGGGTAYNIDAKVTGTGQLNIFAHGNTSDTGGGVGGNLHLGNTGNDFTGNIVIKSGVVSFNGDSAFGNAANTITIEGGGFVATGNRTLASTRSIILSGGGDKIFRVYGSQTLTVQGAISGAGNVRHTDGGTLTLAGTSNFTGNLINAAGTLALSGAQGYTGYLHITNRTTLRLDADNVLPDARTVLMYGGTTFNVNGRTDTMGSLTTGSASDTDVIVNLGSVGSTGTLTVTSNSLPAGMTSGYSEATVHAKVTGSGNLAYVNTGSPTAVWNISNTANDFIGNVVVTAGRIRFLADGALGNAANDLVFNGDPVTTWGDQDGRASLQVTNGTNLTLGSGRTLTLNSGKEGTLHVWGGTTTTVEGQVTGAGGLRKQDSGVLLLSNAANNWSGSLNIVNGEVRIGSAGALSPSAQVFVHAGTLNINGFSSSSRGLSSATGGTLNLGSAGATLTSTGALKPSHYGTQSLDGKITGTGNLTYANATSHTDAWDIRATTNDFVGTITVRSGRMRFASDASLGNLENDLVFDGETVTTWGNGDGRASVQIVNSGDLTFSAARTITLNAGKQGTFYVWGTRLHTVQGQVTGAGGLRKEDDGTLVLGNVTNNWTGDTRVARGTLRVGAAGALSSGTTLLIGGSGTVNLNSLQSSVVGLASEGQTGGLLNGGGRLTVTGGGNYDYSGRVSLSTLRQSGTGTQTLSGPVDNDGALAEVTSGTLVLAKASSATVHAIGIHDQIGLWVMGGTARLGGTGGDQIFTNTHVSVTGGVFDLNARSEGFRALVGDGGAVRNDGVSAATLTLGETTQAGISSAYSGSVGVGGVSALNLTKVGGGAQTLSGALDLGAITVSAGTLTLAGAGAHSGAISVASLATIELDVASEHAIGGALTGAGTLTKSGAGLLLLGTSGGFFGTMNVLAGTARLTADNALGTAGISVAAGATLDLNGRSFSNLLTLAEGSFLVGTGSLVAGSGTLDLSTVELPAEVTISVATGGTLNFGSREYSGNVLYAGGSVVGANFTGNLVVSGTGVQLGAGIGAGTVKIGSGASAVVSAGFTRDILFEGGALGGLSTAGYAGTVTVGAGATLDVDAYQPIDTIYGNIQVQAGSTLAGSGTFAGSVSVSGTLAPGNSPGLMAYEDGLSLGAASVTQWEFDASTVELYVDEFSLQTGRGDGFDAIDITGGTLSIAPGAQLSIVAPTSYDYDAAFWTTTRLFHFVSLGENTNITGQFVFANGTTRLGLTAGRWDILGTNGTDSGVFLQWTPVPEPSTYGLLLGGLALAGAVARRKSRRYGSSAR